MLFSPYDDPAETYELQVGSGLPMNRVPGPDDPPIAFENAEGTLRLMDYFTKHSADRLINAGQIAQELGWDRQTVFKFIRFLLTSAFLKCNRPRELSTSMARIEPSLETLLRERWEKGRF